MAEKKQQSYKTEEQIKQEALARREVEARLAEAAPKKSEKAKKAENFWYHYKWHTIVIVAVAVLGVFFLRDTVLRPKPDATIVLVTERPFDSSQLEALSARLEELAPPNEKGSTLIQVDYINFYPEGDEPLSELSMAASMKLMAVLASGTEYIYLLDSRALDYIEGMNEGAPPGVFEPESVPAENLGIEGFSGLSFHLRIAQENGKGYGYARALMNHLAAG